MSSCSCGHSCPACGHADHNEYSFPEDPLETRASQFLADAIENHQETPTDVGSAPEASAAETGLDTTGESPVDFTEHWVNYIRLAQDGEEELAMAARNAWARHMPAYQTTEEPNEEEPVETNDELLEGEEKEKEAEMEMAEATGGNDNADNW